jgi:hypothetical protein
MTPSTRPTHSNRAVLMATVTVQWRSRGRIAGGHKWTGGHEISFLRTCPDSPRSLDSTWFVPCSPVANNVRPKRLSHPGRGRSAVQIPQWRACCMVARVPPACPPRVHSGIPAHDR